MMAKDARQLTIDSGYNIVFNQIKDACKNGEFSTTIYYKEITDKIKQDLIDFGYTLSPKYGDAYKVSW